MATFLRNLKVRKVDLVDEGANPDAHIKLYKSRDGAGESGGEGENSETGILKRLLGFIGKAAGMEQSEIDDAVDEIQKGDAVSFGEKYNETKNRKIADEIWDICFALEFSLCSILNDEDMDSTKTSETMLESLNAFHATMQGAISNWSEGKVADIVSKGEDVAKEDLELMKAAVEKLNGYIKKASKPASGKPKEKESTENEDEENNNNPKGEEKEMKIDKSKMTDAERVFFEDIEKRYGVDDEPQADNAPAPETEPTGDAPAEPSVNKSAPKTQEPVEDTEPQDSDDIYKGLHPAVKAELESLKKYREAAEDREIAEVAGKYEIIGKKKEELFTVLKGLKKAGGTAYEDMIAILDQAVATVEKSGAFSEIGKAGHGTYEVSDAETQIDNIAKSYIEKDPTMDFATAKAKAWENNPQLMEQYEDETGM